MIVWVDADSCPRVVRSYLLKYTDKLVVPLVFVANRLIPVEKHHPLLRMVVCSKDNSAADDYIVANAVLSDIVITRDIPLASRLIKKNINTLNDRGIVFSNENIQERLSDRNINLQFSQIGLINHSNNTYGKREFAAFANCFDKEIHRILRK